MSSRIRSALAALSDAELGALQTAAEMAPTDLALGLLAYIAHACDWELHRRSGHDFRLTGPMEAIAPDDLEVSATSLAVLSVSFKRRRRVRELLDAIGDSLQEPPPTMH